MSVPTTRLAPRRHAANRENPRSAAVIENRIAVAQFANEPREAQPRRRVRTRSEGEPGIELEIDRIGIDGLVPRGDDPQLLRDLLRRELRLRRAHPVMVGDVERLAGGQPRPAAASRTLAADSSAALAKSAVSRQSGHPRPDSPGSS
jgi:hypothetical protein